MKKKILCTMMSMVMAASLFAGCGTGTGTETSASDNSKTEETGTEAAEQPTSDNPYAAYAGTTISVAAIETGYGSQMWQEVTDAFTEETGIQVELTTDKKLEDVIGPSMQGGEYPDVIHLATGREAALTEQFIKGNMITDITDVLSMKVPGEDKLVSEKIAGGFTDTSLTNPYGDGKTYLAPMFYSPCGLFYNAGLLEEKGWDVPTTWDEMWELGMVEELNNSILASIGSAIAWIFAPLGWTQAGEGWKMAVAAVTGLFLKILLFCFFHCILSTTPFLYK
jgi:N-acetylglucosamine transport system substrate-binding protein